MHQLAFNDITEGNNTIIIIDLNYKAPKHNRVDNFRRSKQI